MCPSLTGAGLAGVVLVSRRLASGSVCCAAAPKYVVATLHAPAMFPSRALTGAGSAGVVQSSRFASRPFVVLLL